MFNTKIESKVLQSPSRRIWYSWENLHSYSRWEGKINFLSFQKCRVKLTEETNSGLHIYLKEKQPTLWKRWVLESKANNLPKREQLYNWTLNTKLLKYLSLLSGLNFLYRVTLILFSTGIFLYCLRSRGPIWHLTLPSLNWSGKMETGCFTPCACLMPWDDDRYLS